MYLGDKSVLITGGTGSIGSALVRRCLLEDVGEVVVLSRDEIKQFMLQRELDDSRLKTFVVDIRDITTLDRIFNLIKKIDIIFHAAAMKHVVVSNNNPIEATLTNVVGTQNIVDIAVKYSIPTSVLISTDKAVEPINVMGATKLIAERTFLNAAKLNKKQVFSIVRFGNVANSRGSVIPVLIESLLSGKELVVTDPKVRRYIMRIEDAVNLIIKAIGLAVGGEIFVLKMPSFELRDLLDVITEKVASHLGVNVKKIKIKQIGLIKGEKLYEKLFFPNEINEIFDLEDLYVVTDMKTFPKHKKYKNNPLAKQVWISSSEASKISLAELEDIVMEYVNQRYLHVG